MKMNSDIPIKIITLGCPKNLVDSETLAVELERSGFHIVGERTHCKAIVINTCGFLQSAKHEAFNVIKTALRQKRSGRTAAVVVVGCMVQRFGSDLAKDFPNVDAWFGVGNPSRIANIIHQVIQRSERLIDITAPEPSWNENLNRAGGATPWSAYLKLADGCNRACSFCAIPGIRGPHVSKPIDKIIAEANECVRRGAKELILIAQDTTQYGCDLPNTPTITDALSALENIEGIEWLRLMYAYPNRELNNIIAYMSQSKKICRYIDIPLQHADGDILRSMHRAGDGESYLKLLETIRSAMPTSAVRTTLIVGFPGETDRQFERLLDFVKAARFDKLGAFAYSREPGTAAYHLPNQIPTRVKQKRLDALMSLQQKISLSINRNLIGKSLPILIEDNTDKTAVGRSYRDAPEIDGSVMVINTNARPGQFINARITDASEYDLTAEPAD